MTGARTRTATWAAALACLLAAACGGGGDGGGDADAPDARALLERAAERFRAVESFHFVYDFDGGSAPIVLNLEMERAEGEVARPDRMRAAVRALAPQLGRIRVEVDFVGVGDSSWITNPFNREEWRALDGNPVASAFDPAAGVEAAVRAVADPIVTGAERVEDVDTWRVEGTLDSGALEAFVTDGEPGHEVRAVVWIDRERFLVRRVRLTGRLAADERADLVRRIELSGFDQPVAIEPPP